jgi:hypothetical protein
MDVSTVVGLRDRAIIAVMTYTFARVGAVVVLTVEDYFPQKRRWWRVCTKKTVSSTKCFDAGTNCSGQQAAQWLACQLGERGVNVCRVSLPEGHDPNSFFVQGGDARQFQHLTEAALE